jgi:large subunit ribosomal protein L27
MAHKKAGSSSKNGRDSVGQRLGIKAGDGQLVNAGSIIVRQRGMTFASGTGTGLGHDYTVFATVTGHVRFDHETRTKKRIRVVAPNNAAEPTVTRASATTRSTASTSAATKPAAKATTKAATSASGDSASTEAAAS